MAVPTFALPVLALIGVPRCFSHHTPQQGIPEVTQTESGGTEMGNNGCYYLTVHCQYYPELLLSHPTLTK